MTSSTIVCLLAPLVVGDASMPRCLSNARTCINSAVVRASLSVEQEAGRTGQEQAFRSPRSLNRGTAKRWRQWSGGTWVEVRSPPRGA
eukprot:15450821-Alexandrium_andersonii.AAC.1